jgi:hypothetical protein
VAKNIKENPKKEICFKLDARVELKKITWLSGSSLFRASTEPSNHERKTQTSEKSDEQGRMNSNS